MGVNCDLRLTRTDLSRLLQGSILAAAPKSWLSAKFRPDNPACFFLYYVTTGTWNGDKDLVVRADAETSDLVKTGMFSKVNFQPIGAPLIHRLYRQTKNAINR